MSVKRPILPWVVWGVALLAYIMAVVNRSSLAALGPTTQNHFGIDATTLSMFAMIQLVVYAGLQIPVGKLIDRLGPTVLMLSGGMLMVVGQTAMALAGEVWIAILARVFVGAGDACTFICVMRMLPEWFSVRQLPTLSQLTSLTGQAGQLISVTPLAFVVTQFGWTTGFLGVAAVGLLVVLLGAVTLRDAPGVGTLVERMTGRMGKATRGSRSLGANEPTGMFMTPPPATDMIAIPRALRGGTARGLLGIPGIRLAYWLHFTSVFSLISFLLLWGTPFLIGGAGLSQRAAAGLLSFTVIVTMVGGLLLGPLSTRFARQRVWITWSICLGILITWALTLLWPGVPPMWLIVATLVMVALGGPASMIAFEVLRSHSPRRYAGFSTGLVNTAGYTATLLVIMFIGLLLDWQGAGSPETYTPAAFKTAFAVQIPFLLLGLTLIVVEWVRTRRWMIEHGRTL